MDPVVRRLFRLVETWYAYCLPSHAVVPKPKEFFRFVRLKTYLRNSIYLRNLMSRARLNHLAILHVHQEMTDGIDVLSVAKDFVAKSDSRMFTFGHVNRADSCSVLEIALYDT